MKNIFFDRNNKSRSSAFRNFLFYQSIICFDWVMNLFLFCVIFFIKKGSFLAETAAANESKIFKLRDLVLLNNLATVFKWENKQKPTKIISHLFRTQDGTTSTQYKRKFPEFTTKLSHHACMLCNKRLDQVTK